MTTAEFITACKECNTPRKAAELLRNACMLAVKYDKQADTIQQYAEQVKRLTNEISDLTAELEDKRIQLEQYGDLDTLIGRLGAVAVRLEQTDKPAPPEPPPKPPKKQSKKADSDKEPRSRYGEYKHVLLTGAQYAKLVSEYGAKVADEYVRKVDEYCQQYGKTYNDYNLAIRKFMRDDNKAKAVPVTAESGGGVHSYDLDKLVNHAKKNIPSLK